MKVLPLDDDDNNEKKQGDARIASVGKNDDSSLDPSDKNDEAEASFSSSSKSDSKRCPQRVPTVTTPKRGFSGSSSDGDDDEEENGEIKIPSFHNSRTAAATNQSHENGGDPSSDSQANNAASSSVSADQERQILLLMLLAQVCALHDPTPRTFTVHVLELFERGILGRQSIHFLFELGLVPSTTPRLLPPSTTGTESHSPAASRASLKSGDSKQEVLDLATVPSAAASPTSPQSLRTQEASAIRSHLEQHDLAQAQPGAGNTLNPNLDYNNKLLASATTEKKQSHSSWSVAQHPLSLSRYQREFHQVRLLNSGSFGEVFQATSKIDRRDYAVKRVSFSAWGYSKDSVSQVIREVHCLAQCDHPNVVRYYTSWLEPSWMTGSGATMMTSSGSTSADVRQQQKLLTDIQHMMITGGSDADDSQVESRKNQPSSNDGSTLQDFFYDHGASLRNRKFSIGSSLDSLDSDGSSYDETSSEDEGGHCSQWTIEDDRNQARDDSILFESRARDDSILFERSHQREVWESSHSSPPRRRTTHGQAKKQQTVSLKYRYQICLYIQMQLCQPATLGDWIRNRNLQTPDPDQGREERVKTAFKIFGQIVSGLNHIHKKDIVHRDLKPANLFRSLEDDGVFLIGDFGLSKLIHSATHQKRHCRQHSSDADGKSPVFPPTEAPDADSTWRDPLTAGVGTASYAASEQISTRTYGKKADIFSVGLILLEMMCCFTTEHERMQTFFDCRHRRDLPTWLSEDHPTAASTILACTTQGPALRPSAEQLMETDLLFAPTATSTNSNSKSGEAKCNTNPSNEDDDSLVASLRQELEVKKELIRNYEQRMVEKDQTIDDLRQQLARLRANQGGLSAVVGMPERFPRIKSGDQQAVGETASSSSSEDGI
jgi:translation initiation factor 2-alpha kinase 1